MAEMHYIDTLIQLRVGLPNRIIIIFAGEIDDPCLVGFEKGHIFIGLLDVQVDEVSITRCKQP